MRDQRLAAGLTLPGLAARADVSRRWLASLEAGSPGASIAKVLRTLHELDIAVAASIAPPNRAAGDSRINLDDVLDEHTNRS